MTKYSSSYHRLAKIYSKQAGVELLIRGDGFSTTGKSIYIADIPDELNRKLKDPCLAGLLHECLHVEHTKMRTLGEIRNLPEQDREIFTKYKGLGNNIEDIRMLALGQKQYEGMNGLQKTGLTFLKGYIIKAIDEKEIDHATLLGICIHYKKSNMDVSFIPKTFREMAEKTEHIWSDPGWKPYEKGHLQSMEITKGIIKKLKLEHEKIKEEQEKGKEEDEDEDESTEDDSEDDSEEGNGESGEGEGGDGSDDTDSPDESGDSGDESGSDEDEDEETEDDDEGSGGSTDSSDLDEEQEKDSSEEGDSDEEGDEDGGGERDDVSESESDGVESGSEESDGEPKGKDNKIDGEDLEKDLENLLDQEYKEKKDGTISNSLSEGVMKAIEGLLRLEVQDWNHKNNQHVPHPDVIPMDVEEKVYNPWKKGKENEYKIKELERSFSEISSGVDVETRKLKARILPLLLAEKRSSFRFEQEEGVIDDAQLYKLLKGNGKIYKQRVPGKKVNTAVSILNDVSGSMSGSPIDMLRPTLLVIADTLFSLKIPFEILTFTTVRGRSVHITTEDRDIYNRFEPLRHTIVKDFNQNHLLARKLIPLIQASCNNIDNESVVWAARRLAERNEQRKILFVLSDGQPAGHCTHYRLLGKDLKEQVKKIEKSGIEVVGIGLLTSTPKKFFLLLVRLIVLMKFQLRSMKLLLRN